MSNAHNDAVSLDALDLREECLRLRREHLTHQEIANRLGVERSTVTKHISEGLEQRRKDSPNAAALAQEESEKLDTLDAIVDDILDREHITVNNGRVIFEPGTERALRDDDPIMRAVQTKLRIAERRAKLMGLDAKAEAEVTGEVHIVVEYVTEDTSPTP